jgi:hypothetical protein
VSDTGAAGDTVVALLSSRRGRLGTCEREALRAALAAGADLGLPVVAIAASSLGAREPALVIALRAGCARAISVDLEPAEVDYRALARGLAGAVGAAGPRLVLAGDQSETSRRGAVGPAIAEMLGLPHLSGVLAVDVVDAELRCRANLDGERRWFAVKLPALLCVRAAGRPAPPPRRAPGAVVEHHEAGEIGPRASGGRAVSVPPRGGAAIAESAADLVRRLREDHLLR